MKYWLSIVTTVFLLAGCGSTPDSTNHLEDEYAQWIPTTIQGEDRITFINALSMLPPDRRDNATVITLDGRVLTNSNTLKSQDLQKSILTSEKIGDNLYRYKETGQTYSTFNDSQSSDRKLKSAAIDCSAGSNTGPFYRAHSKPGLGGANLNYWTASKASVMLPTYNSFISGTETPYILLGGWKSINDTSTGGVDAGIQGNPKVDSTGNKYIEWQIFLKSGGVTAPSSSAVRFSSGETLDIVFTVTPTSPTTMQANLSLSTAAKSVAVSTTVNWPQNGYGAVMKRMTGIASPGTASTNAVMQIKTWSNIMIGGYRGSAFPYSFTYVNWSGNGQKWCYNLNSSQAYLDDYSIQDYLEDVYINKQ